jgi:STE24 endopeptidase
MKPSLARRYQYQKLAISLIQTAITLIFLFLVVQMGGARALVEWIETISSQWKWQLLLFILVFGGASFLLDAPLSFISGYYLEHRYQLSSQSFGRYLWEEAKGLFLALLLGVPILYLFYYLILKSPHFYWVYLAGFLFFFSVILAQIAPKIILPLFYKLIPLSDESLKSRLRDLCAREGFTLKEVFSFNLSKNTRKANAAFLGLGRTRTIILADTLLEKFTPEEIEGVFAHELGHLVRRHIFKQLMIGLILNFGGLYLLSKIYQVTVAYYGGQGLHDLGVLPMFFFWAVLGGFLVMPFSNSISRRFEWEADEYACQKSPHPEFLISSFEKLAEINLADPSPPRWVEIFFHSHPAVEKRIAHVKQCLNKSPIQN